MSSYSSNVFNVLGLCEMWSSQPHK